MFYILYYTIELATRDINHDFLVLINRRLFDVVANLSVGDAAGDGGEVAEDDLCPGLGAGHRVSAVGQHRHFPAHQHHAHQHQYRYLDMYYSQKLVREQKYLIFGRLKNKLKKYLIQKSILEKNIFLKGKYMP